MLLSATLPCFVLFRVTDDKTNTLHQNSHCNPIKTKVKLSPRVSASQTHVQIQFLHMPQVSYLKRYLYMYYSNVKFLTFDVISRTKLDTTLTPSHIFVSRQIQSQQRSLRANRCQSLRSHDRFKL